MPKQKPIGICDHCDGEIPRGRWYTKHGPRMYCSFDCRQIGNSRSGSAKRSAKAKQRVASGTWINPRADLDPETVKHLQSDISRKARLHEVAEGRWRNPALSDDARRKLSRPRKHNGALHRAIEKLRRGSTETLTPAEHRAYRKYRKQLRDARRDDVNRLARERYHKKRRNK